MTSLSPQIYNDCRQVIESWWSSHWDPATLPYTFENLPKPLSAERWASISILFGRNVGRGISGAYIESVLVGTVQVTFFESRDVGAASVYTLADEARRLFEGKHISGMKFGDANLVRTDDETQPFYQVNMSVSFMYDNLTPKGTID